MLRLYENPKLHKALGRAARTHMETRFDRNHVWRDLKAFYQQALK